MSLQSLKRRADELASDARRLRRERNDHALQSLAILRRRLGSPAGLALCFSAGVVAGSASPGRRPGEGNGGRTTEPGFANRLLHGPLGAAAFRLASAFIAGAMMQPEGTK